MKESCIEDATVYFARSEMNSSEVVGGWNCCMSWCLALWCCFAVVITAVMRSWQTECECSHWVVCKYTWRKEAFIRLLLLPIIRLLWFKEPWVIQATRLLWRLVFSWQLCEGCRLIVGKSHAESKWPVARSCSTSLEPVMLSIRMVSMVLSRMLPSKREHSR